MLGGFTSIPGAIVGGLIVGVGEKLFEFLIGAPFLGGATENWFAYMLALVFWSFGHKACLGRKSLSVFKSCICASKGFVTNDLNVKGTAHAIS